MSEDGKKVIKVSQEVSAKLPKRLVLALSGMGVILEVRETAPTILELGEALILETAVETEKISNFFEEDKRQQDEKSKLVGKYVPRKIGKPCRAKINNIKGKRYGR